ncbi:hypothetical protein MTF65_11155 [Streptomyces sp. APSN-46.1]|uniref:hypothetical protein n=1 Tax=Streptomyces sp. APSN-46.1 TaxID=2929049 RepID=UPI001FB4F1CB|nr:hypothetical protein [Streptomyces sp. APSN-46.1]MCJ1677891.1 hypothetical protein [Streptomyces sp. APSN-46.1]
MSIDQRDWAFPTFKARFEHAARDLARDEETPHLARLTLTERTYERWLSGAVRPNPDARRVLSHLFDHPIEALLASAPVTDADISTEVPHAQHNVGPGVDMDEMRRKAAMAANRALRYAVMAESQTLGSETLDHIHEEVARIARAYPRVPLHDILGDLVEVQDLTFPVLEANRASPAQSRDLHLYAAMSAGMLAKASHDLADPRAAMMQAPAAYVYADKAGHGRMCAWTRGLQSLISYWAGRPADAAAYAARGSASLTVPAGTVTVWLASLEARAHAVLGEAQKAHEAVRKATEVRDTAESDDLDEVGGIFVFPRPRQAYYGVEAAVLLGEATGDVERDAVEAVRAYRTAKSEAPDEWAFGDEAGACTNLAIVRIGRGDVEGASEAVQPVLELPPSQHNAGIVISARRVHSALSHSSVRTAARARELRGHLELFTATTTPSLAR